MQLIPLNLFNYRFKVVNCLIKKRTHFHLPNIQDYIIIILIYIITLLLLLSSLLKTYPLCIKICILATIHPKYTTRPI